MVVFFFKLFYISAIIKAQDIDIGFSFVMIYTVRCKVIAVQSQILPHISQIEIKIRKMTSPQVYILHTTGEKPYRMSGCRIRLYSRNIVYSQSFSNSFSLFRVFWDLLLSAHITSEEIKPYKESRCP